MNFITQTGHSPKVSQGQPDSDKTSNTIHSRKAILSFVHYFVWDMESTRMMLCDMGAKHRRWDKINLLSETYFLHQHDDDGRLYKLSSLYTVLPKELKKEKKELMNRILTL